MFKWGRHFQTGAQTMRLADCFSPFIKAMTVLAHMILIMLAYVLAMMAVHSWLPLHEHFLEVMLYWVLAWYLFGLNRNPRHMHNRRHWGKEVHWLRARDMPSMN